MRDDESTRKESLNRVTSANGDCDK
uniref:Uncharacterized protein n=1 Tax=Rhizophora mucronata TaxID=61149 RepID=A0A2P2IVA3_RHIMU